MIPATPLALSIAPFAIASPVLPAQPTEMIPVRRIDQVFVGRCCREGS